MNITINELQEKWNSISPYTGGFLLVSGNHPLAFHIGYYGEQMCFMVLNTGKKSKINSSKAIHASCVQTDDNKYALQFLLNYSSLTELFIKLCWDLIDCSKNSPNPVDAIIDRFNAWIRLLQKKGEGLLSSSAQKGLIGELLFLKESIISRGAQISLTAWVGPEGSDQDYLFESEWCEIKATTVASVSVSISSLQQLDREDFGRLIVYFMDKTTAKGERTVSLPEVVNDVKSILTTQSLIDVFSCKLAMYGYYFKDAERYTESRYRLAEKRTYEVRTGFPKLTRYNVPNGILNAVYELDFSSIDQFKI